MKYGVLAALLVVVGLSCFVDRRSGDFACEVDADCAGLGGGIDRECNDNVCVEVDCPNECDACSAGKICNITCNGSTECTDGVDCPRGYNCQVLCTRNCTPVDCTDAASCLVTCSGNNNTECGPLDCGSATPCMCVAANGTCL